MRKTLLLLACMAFVPAMPARAAITWCVDTPAALQGALTAAQANGDDDYISLVAGSYNLPVGLVFDSQESHNLILLGGFDAGCNGPGGETWLNGQGAVRPLTVQIDSGRLLIHRITFFNGFASTTGGGLSAVTQTGNLSILLGRFIANASTAGAGGAYLASASGKIYVTGSLVHANHGAAVGGMVLDQNDVGLVLNNTLAANITDAPTAPGGLLLGGSGHYDVGNNIVWDNAPPGGADFRADAPHRRRHNDMEIVAGGFPPDSTLGELSVDPQFEDCGFACLDLRLSPASPLVDAGLDAILEDLGPGPVDIDGLPRLLGPHIDIGAYENEILFVDGFGP